MKYFVFSLVLSVTLLSCISNQRNETDSITDSLDIFNRSENKTDISLAEADSLKEENFKEFYANFLRDSLFQISRIKFPLKGQKIVDDEDQDWTLDNWTLMRSSVYEIDTTQYKVEIEDSDTLKSFRIFIPDSGFELIFKFEIIRGKWYLVYCKDMFS
jgi:hypothetical protein